MRWGASYARGSAASRGREGHGEKLHKRENCGFVRMIHTLTLSHVPSSTYLYVKYQVVFFCWVGQPMGALFTPYMPRLVYLPTPFLARWSPDLLDPYGLVMASRRRAG